MSPKRDERVAPPPAPGGYDIVYGNTEACKGWQDLSNQAQGPTRLAYEAILADPQPVPPTARHHRLKADLATGSYKGKTLPQWQYEVTGGGRIWYVVDVDKLLVAITYASMRHPKATDR